MAHAQALTAEQAARLRRQKEELEGAVGEERGEGEERAREPTRGRTLRSSNCTTVEWSADGGDWRVDCQLGRERYPSGRTTRVSGARDCRRSFLDGRKVAMLTQCCSYFRDSNHTTTCTLSTLTSMPDL